MKYLKPNQENRLLLCALLTVVMLQDFTYKQTRPAFPCQKRVWRGSTFPDLNHFCQAKNYQLLGNPNSALVADRSSLMVPGNKQLIKAAWYFLNLHIHHFMRCPCPPLTSSVSVLACPFLPLPVLLMCSLFFLCLSLTNLIFHFCPIWSPHLNEHISAHPQRVLLSVRALKMSHTALFPDFFSLFFLGSPLSFLPPFPCPVLPPPSACNQSPGNWRAARIQFASALLRLKNQEELFSSGGSEENESGGREGGWLEGVERKRRKCSSSSVVCCMELEEGGKQKLWEGEKRELQVIDFQLWDVWGYQLNSC